MTNLIEKITNFLLFINQKLLEKKYGVCLSAKNQCTIGTTKRVLGDNESLEITSQTNLNRHRADAKIKKIVNANLKTPEKLLEYVEKGGTPVYKINNADLILKYIKEEEGFITELKGFKALYLNFIISLIAKKQISIKFSTPAMFILRDLPVDPYYMIHQFYKWYGYKIKLPGYDYKTQKNFKTTFNTLANKDISKLNLDEIIAVKEAINRDKEAIDFVLNLCKETSGSKKALQKILNGEGARI